MAEILTILGARPQFIKASMVSRALKAVGHTQEKVLHTGQHYDPSMSDIFFEELGMETPQYNLGIGGGTHGQNTGRMIEGIESVLINEKPDLVLVYGDTNSTLAGSLAASKLSIPVAHVESGLRSFNRKMPEEINRVIVDQISSVHFTPTDLATKNLVREGIDHSSIHQTGDVMYDAALFFGGQSDGETPQVRDLISDKKPFALATIHRQENTEDIKKLENIINSLEEIAEGMPVVWPVHPRIRGKVCTRKLRLIDPCGYIEMQKLIRHSKIVLTDSGGLQKEAFFHRVPCVTLRGETEWVELVDSGWNELVAPCNSGKIVDCVSRIMNSEYKREVGHWYGKGDAAGKIASVLSR